MADNVSIKDGANASVVAATDELSDTSQSPKVTLLDGTGSPTPISPATSGKQDTGNTSLASILAKQPSLGTAGSASSNVITVQGVASMTPVAVSVGSPSGTRIEGTIAAGGTAQNIFSATPANGFEVINVHATEMLYIRESGTATAAANSNNIWIVPGGSYVTPLGYKPGGDVSVIAATTGHAFIARRW